MITDTQSLTVSGSPPPLNESRLARTQINSAQLSGALGIDVEGYVNYGAPTGFSLTWELVVDPAGPRVQTRPLVEADLRSLLDKIHATLATPPSGLDTIALEAFGDLIDQTLSGSPFDQPDSAPRSRRSSAVP